jgi:hypothetical protein
MFITWRILYAAGVLSLPPGATFIGTNVDDNIDTRNGALNGGRSDQANITLDGRGQ